MNQFFATFSPGFQEYIHTALARDLPDCTIRHIHEASVCFSTHKPYRTVIKHRYLSQLYPVVASLKLDGSESPSSVVKKLTANARYGVTLNQAELRAGSTFRVMVQQGNQLVGIPKDVARTIHETVISQTGMEHSPLKADLEIWIMIRTEGYAYLGIKVPSAQPSPEKGELQPHVATVLNLMSNPAELDVYLDPFCGNGALPANRTLWPYHQIYASDKHQPAVDKTDRALASSPRCRTTKADARKLTHLADSSIDKIVTDPPWGMFEMRDVNFFNFYSEVMKEFVRILKPGGDIIFLTARVTEFEQVCEKNTQLVHINQINTLVNGKKATAFHVRKIT